MRMRRRRVVRARRKTAWMSGSNPGCVTPLSIFLCNNEAQRPDVFTVIENPSDVLPGLVSSVSEVTLLRLVGEQIVGIRIESGSSGGTGAAVVAEGFYIADTEAGVLNSIKDPGAAIEQSSGDWLWRRTQVFPLDTVRRVMLTGDISAVATSHIDVKVKRKLRKEEGIFYAVKVLLDNGTTSPLVFTNIGGGFDVNNVVPFAVGSVRALVALP